jgi:N-acetylglutamate synthase
MFRPGVTSTRISTTSMIKKDFKSYEALERINFLNAITMITPADILEGQAYRLVDRSIVMTCPLNQGLVQTQPSGQPNIKASLPPEDWLAHYYSVSGKATGHSSSHLQLLELMPDSTNFAALSQDDQALSCGIGVLTKKSLGLFEIATRPSHRRQGLASTLCHNLLAWGYSKGF